MGTEDDRGAVHSETEDGGAGVTPAPPVPSGGPDSETPADSAPAAEEEPDKGDKGDKGKKTKEQRSFWKELPILVVIALVLAFVIKTFAVQAFYIPSGSMENTLRIGDRILVNKIVYHTRSIKRGDIVVFKVPDSWDAEVPASEPSNPVSRVLHDVGGFFGLAPTETDYIKRVIGVPGDRVSCAGPNAPLTVNGHALQETGYLYPGNKPCEGGPAFDKVVPKGMLWVMGDHRGNSADSRAHIDSDPFVPEKRVIGRAFVIVWPVTHWSFLSIPATFGQSGLAQALLPSAPVALGLLGATPLVLVRRRVRRRRAARLG